jgi:hypothetical protein
MPIDRALPDALYVNQCQIAIHFTNVADLQSEKNQKKGFYR